MSHIIIFGSIGFFIIALIAIGLILWALDNALSHDHDDNGGGALATVFVGGFISLYYFFGSKDHVNSIINYVGENPSSLFWGICTYLVLGVIWGFVKWYFYLHKRVAKEIAYTKKNIITEYTTVSIPNAGENKWRIMSWMMYWPFSAFWTVIDQPIKNTFNYIFVIFESAFNKISVHMYKDVVSKVEAKKKTIRETTNVLPEKKNSTE